MVRSALFLSATAAVFLLGCGGLASGPTTGGSGTSVTAGSGSEEGNGSGSHADLAGRRWNRTDHTSLWVIEDGNGRLGPDVVRSAATATIGDIRKPAAPASPTPHSRSI
jgi:hypothetical protein